MVSVATRLERSAASRTASRSSFAFALLRKSKSGAAAMAPIPAIQGSRRRAT
jgi:hypothetical protein